MKILKKYIIILTSCINTAIYHFADEPKFFHPSSPKRNYQDSLEELLAPPQNIDQEPLHHQGPTGKETSTAAPGGGGDDNSSSSSSSSGSDYRRYQKWKRKEKIHF